MENTSENKINIDKNIDKKQIKNIICQLFKFDKSFFISFVFYIHIFVQILVFIWNLYISSQYWFFHFLLSLLFSPFIFFIVRLVFEILVVLFNINDNLLEVKNNLKK